MIAFINQLRYLKMEAAHWTYDLGYSIGFFQTPIPHLVKRRVVRRYAKKYNIRCFIETGTYFGEMLAAVAPVFEELHSIELSPIYYQRAKQRLSHQPNIHLYQGDSAILLPLLLERCSRRTIFWLDAHYSGGDTASAISPTPITNELESILQHRIPDHVVLIDDARHFNGTNGYPTLEEIKEMVFSLRSDYVVEIIQDIIRLTPMYRLH